jgi:hypothetical protein
MSTDYGRTCIPDNIFFGGLHGELRTYEGVRSTPSVWTIRNATDVNLVKNPGTCISCFLAGKITRCQRFQVSEIKSKKHTGIDIGMKRSTIAMCSQVRLDLHLFSVIIGPCTSEMRRVILTTPF